MKWSSRRIVTVLLLVAGLGTVVEAAWIPLKARLAQTLLEHAWDRARGGEIGAKPWSWADTTPVAKLRIPSQTSEMIVLDGASGRTLAFGPGHVNGTALPGAEGNSVLAGHRDTHFRVLEEVTRGDRLEIDTLDGRTVAYVVTSVQIVMEDEVGVLRQDDRRRLTLVTCYPFDAIRPGGPMRYVVVARAD
ncbi:MAG: class GN sortase, partial [Thermoanaerobaculia bacterium]|nr:class GN sortase [Thermoanaerobaculia bacterium]